ncbi:MAG: hypothetical protein GY861_12395, partial [bacterium]|nr:hypothetical protein [bacterium]
MNYIELAEVYERLEATTKRLEKTYIISEFLKKIPEADLPQTTLLLEGRLYPAWDEREVGVASQLLLKAICVATGSDAAAVEKCLKATGDLGKVAEELSKKKKQVTLFSQQLTVKKVFNNLRKLSETTGAGSVDRKIQLIAELLTSSKPIEARYIIRTTLGDLRVGVGSGSMRDAIVWAYFPKIVGIFFKCNECRKWAPNSKKCVECGKAIDNNPAKEIKRFNE